MDFRAIKHISHNRYFPLNFNVGKMQPNILLMCKLLFLLLVVHGFHGYISDPFIPFFRSFDFVLNYPNLFKITIKLFFLGSGTLMLFNVKPRTMSIILGCSVIFMLLASKSMFRNHLFICGCAFLLAGLTDKKEFPWLLCIQLSLVYFGAVLNKIFEPDWWSGQFMYNWLVNSKENQFFITVSAYLPDMWLAKILSWSSILIEFSIAILLWFRKKHVLAVWIILLFHSLLYTMTLFRFGHFFDDIVIILLIFLVWPKTEIVVYFNKNINSFLRPIIDFFFLNSTVVYKEKMKENTFWLKVESDTKTLTNNNALRHLLKFTPNFYISIFLLDQFIRFIFNGTTMHIIQLVIFWTFVIFYLPINFANKNHKIISVDEK